MRLTHLQWISAFFLLILVGCTYTPPVVEENLSGMDLLPNGIGTPPGIETPEETPLVTITPPPTETSEPSEGVNVNEVPILKVREGDVVSFPNLRVTDPDGDPVTYTFSSPLAADGTWQTKIGDAGQYKIKISASDGKSIVSQDVLIIVEPRNAPPIIKDLGELTFREGDKIELNPSVTDNDGDQVQISYSGWMTGNSKLTTYDDAGTYQVTITADDGKSATQRTVTLKILNVNRAPVISPIDAVTIKAGQKVTVKPQGSDPDGDVISYKFSEPLDESGSWRPEEEDVGVKMITVTASDGFLETSVRFNLTVEQQNSAPTIQIQSPINVRENDLVVLTPVVQDADGDPVTVTYSGWMTTSTKQTGFSDQGTHVVTITASDGKTSSTADVTINVQDVNRPPSFQDLI